MASPASESKPNVAKTTPVSCPVFGNKRPTTDLLESLEFEEELDEELELDDEVELEELELEEGPVVLGEVVVPVPESL